VRKDGCKGLSLLTLLRLKTLDFCFRLVFSSDETLPNNTTNFSKSVEIDCFIHRTPLQNLRCANMDSALRRQADSPYTAKSLLVKLQRYIRNRQRYSLQDEIRTGVRKDSATNLALAFNYSTLASRYNLSNTNTYEEFHF
jgi:hypothetical protein